MSTKSTERLISEKNQLRVVAMSSWLGIEIASKLGWPDPLPYHFWHDYSCHGVHKTTADYSQFRLEIVYFDHSVIDRSNAFCPQVVSIHGSSALSDRDRFEIFQVQQDPGELPAFSVDGLSELFESSSRFNLKWGGSVSGLVTICKSKGSRRYSLYCSRSRGVFPQDLEATADEFTFSDPVSYIDAQRRANARKATLDAQRDEAEVASR